MKRRGRVFQMGAWMAVLALSLASLATAQNPKINLNTATVSELESLPGIGVAIAGRIVEFREENGPFRRIEDLMNVRGIGEKKFLQLRDRITVKEASKAR